MGNFGNVKMKLEQKKTALRMGAVALCALALTACGGDDDSAAAAPGAPGGTGGTGTPGGGTQTIVTGKVDAPFVPTATARYLAIGEGIYTDGALDPAKQESDGAFRAFSSYRVASTTKVGAMSGNATFALGSWVGPVINASTGAELKSSSGLAYVAYNRTATVAADGTLNCTPQLTSPRAAIGSGETLTGPATMTIASGIVSMKIDMKLKAANGNESPLTFDGKFDNGIGAINYTGGFLAGTPTKLEYGVGVAAGAEGGHLVIVPWKLPASGGTAQGIAVLTCKRPT